MTRKRYNINTESRTFEGKPVRKIPWPRVQPSGFAFMGRIYLRDAHWEDYLTGHPSPKTLSILVHENTHAERLGRNIKPHIKYWLNRDFRLHEELLAIQSEMEVLKQYGESFDIEKRAKDLSSVAYLWCTDFDTAVREMDSMWKSDQVQ